MSGTKVTAVKKETKFPPPRSCSAMRHSVKTMDVSVYRVEVPGQGKGLTAQRTGLWRISESAWGGWRRGGGRRKCPPGQKEGQRQPGTGGEG